MLLQWEGVIRHIDGSKIAKDASWNDRHFDSAENVVVHIGFLSGYSSCVVADELRFYADEFKLFFIRAR